MKRLEREDIQQLIRKEQEKAVSIYLPTLKSGKEIGQNRIRFKNLVREAEEELKKHGVRSGESTKMLKPAYDLLENSKFWQHQTEGLAVFISADGMEYFQLPYETSEFVVCCDHYHIKPLLPVIGDDHRFFVMAASKNRVKLYEGTRFSLDEISPEDLPEGVAETLRYDDFEKEVSWYTGTPGRVGLRDAVFFGTGAADPDVKNHILRYFQQVDGSLRNVLKDESAPLVFAGVDYLFPIFKEANTYSHLAHEMISGNPESLSQTDMHKKAWEIVRPIADQARLGASEKYRQLKSQNSDQVSCKIEEIVPAAAHGRIDVLFVDIDAHQWGRFDPDNNDVEMGNSSDGAKFDLIDFAAVRSLDKGATVYALQSSELPDSSPVAAMFRY
jgi:hypothetical protein